MTTFDAPQTQAADTNPTRAERAGMIVLIVLALAIVTLTLRPTSAPICVDITPVMEVGE